MYFADYDGQNEIATVFYQVQIVNFKVVHFIDGNLNVECLSYGEIEESELRVSYRSFCNTLVGAVAALE